MVLDEIAARVLKYIMTQHTLTKGLKLYGRQGKQAVQKELRQLHDLHTYEPVDASTLTYKNEEAIVSLMFLSEKRDESIKARVYTMETASIQRKNRNSFTFTMVMTES